MNITKAIHETRKEVGEIQPFGNNYKFLYYDEEVNAWREHICCDYHKALGDRSRKMIGVALRKMGFSYLMSYDAEASYLDGSWVNHLRYVINS